MPISVSDSKAEDNRQAIGDSGIGANKNSVAARDKARVASKKSTIAEAGSTVVSGGTLNTGLSISDNKGPVTIDTGGEMVAKVSSDFQDTLRDVSTAAITQSNNALKELGSQLSGLAESKQTSGESGRDKKVLYMALATVTALAVTVYYIRK